ncbi:MAG: hypothetical protein IT545_08945, partial [Rhodobacteraceae bacterium]|nr:hypothetical protein [Paracoccaceae bacterium]
MAGHDRSPAATAPSVPVPAAIAVAPSVIVAVAPPAVVIVIAPPAVVVIVAPPAVVIVAPARRAATIPVGRPRQGRRIVAQDL